MGFRFGFGFGFWPVRRAVHTGALLARYFRFIHSEATAGRQRGGGGRGGDDDGDGDGGDRSGRSTPMLHSTKPTTNGSPAAASVVEEEKEHA